MQIYYTHEGSTYTGRHPLERQPSPSQQKHPHRAVQPYKPKPLAPGDIVRFKNGVQDWKIARVDKLGYHLTRREDLRTYFRTVDPADEHRLLIIAQAPRHAGHQRK